MDDLLIFLISVCEPVAIGLILMFLPRFTRRGLLFGVYVGPEVASGDDVRSITRGWYYGMILTAALCALTGSLLWVSGRTLSAFLTPDFVLLCGFAGSYLRSHRAALHLVTVRVPPPPAIASLEPAKRSLTLPALTLVVGVVAGLLTVWYGWSSYDALPDRMPTHFSASGRPDAWSAKSFASVMALPLTTLAMGAGMGVLALLLAGAKRALRLEKSGVSAWAQQKYRSAVVGYLCVLTLIVVAMLTIMSVGAIRVGLGRAERLSPAGLLLALVLVIWAIGGSIYIAVRMGQGGAKLEASVAQAPLTDGLADNDKWKLGVIYVNRDDPSMFVEHRFGIGYTINFGNPKAVAFIVILLVALVAIPIWLSVSQ